MELRTRKPLIRVKRIDIKRAALRLSVEIGLEGF